MPGVSAYLDLYVPGHGIYLDRVPREAQLARDLALQSMNVSHDLLDDGLLLGAAGPRVVVYGEVPRGGPLDEV